MSDWYYCVLLFTLSVCFVNSNHRATGAAVFVKRSASNNKDLPPECTEKFQAMENSTMCLHDSPDVLESGMTEEEKTFVLDLHNRLRAEVEPAATNMRKMVWDENVAAIAQKWAKQCVVAHDFNRWVPDYGMSMGQNAAGGHGSWELAVMGWYKEKNLFKYGEDPSDYLGKDGWKKVGHYTQVVQARSVRLGCGFAKCSSKYGRYYICNYGPGQNNVPEPYESGDRCSKCPDSCTNGLCDCGGKVCRNRGKLDINTCTCSCKELYSGDECEILNCPERDATFCWFTNPKGHCKYSNVKPKCPYMCGICGGPGAATPPPVIVTSSNCTYTGFQETEEKCATYGDNGADTRSCISTGGKQFGCSDCLKYSNVKTDYCPVMCGVCKGPCDGLTCKNRGKLDRENCKCVCKGFFEGKECEKALKPPVIVTPFNCTYIGFQETDEKCAKYGDKGIDKWPCKSTGGTYYGCSDCVSNVPTDYCPVMCGLCKGPCDGLTCKNGGKLDRENCKCVCKGLFEGKECEKAIILPVIVTPFNCTYKGFQESEEICAKYGNKGADKWPCKSTGGTYYGCSDCVSNIPTDYCPVMCGLCKGPCDGLTCKNGGKLDRENCKCVCKGLFEGKECEKAITLPVIVTPFNCTYKGFQESEEKCATYGDKGLDRWPCKSTGGTYYGCSDCVSNIPTDYCPVMCGLCKAPCNGLTCKNGGKLDRENCKCDCHKLYMGEACDQVNCPEKDDWPCRTQWPPEYCTKFSNVPGRCPYMCGLCQKND